MPKITKDLWIKYFPKYEPRPQQIKAINTILDFFLNQNGEVFLLNAATGIGKTFIGLTIARFFASRQRMSSYIVHSKYLEEQIRRECKSFIVKTLGRNNFDCLVNGNSADYGECRVRHDYRCEYSPSTKGYDLAFTSYKRGPLYWKGDKKCSYWNMKATACNFPIVVHNYYYFLFENNYINDFGPRYFMVLDEGQNIEKCILDFVSFTLSTYHKKYGIPLPDKIPEVSINKWLPILNKILTFLDKTIPEIKQRLDKSKYNLIRVNNKLFSEKDLIDMSNFYQELKEFYLEISKNPSDWIPVYEKTKTTSRVIFKPIYISKYTNKLLFRFGDKLLIMSATLLSERMIKRTLGLGNKKTMYLDLESPFPAERRKVIYIPVAKLSKRTMYYAVDKLVPIIKGIVNKHKDKGIIHTRSYHLAKQIVQKINQPRLLFHNSQNKEEVIDLFMNSDKPYVLVSPSLEEGVDLKDDLCRFIIIVKIPYDNLGDAQIRKRLELDPDWYQWSTVQSLIQMSGRGVRHKEDYCTTYILDSNFSRLHKQYKEFFPNWYRESIEKKSLY